MPSWSELVGFLSYYGFTPESVTPLVVVGYVLYTLINRRLSQVKDRTDEIEKCVVELQGVLRNKYQLQFQQSVASKYGQAHSPIVLRPEFRRFIIEPGLADQIKAKLPALISLLKELNPQTGLDAQDFITGLILSDEINQYLDLTKYKQYLYEQGKTSEDAAGILALYLFETLIPELNLPESDTE